jgi:hypothetical protein
MAGAAGARITRDMIGKIICPSPAGRRCGHRMMMTMMMMMMMMIHSRVME